MSAASIALHRFGLGARPNDVVAGDPQAWLLGQFARYRSEIANAPTSTQAAAVLADYVAERRSLRMAGAAQPQPQPTMADSPSTPMRKPEAQAALQPFRADARRFYTESVAARTASALATDTPFVERLVHFWANHFAVSADKLLVSPLVGTLEFEAIRPHVLGRFGDMLVAVERHPAMLLYLDQAQSIGPNSRFAARVATRGVRKVGLNENLAREILELHTLGVRTGYGQADVTEFARALTGRTVAGLGGRQLAPGAPGDFAYVDAIHEPGDRMILGKRYPAGGVEQSQAVLGDLAIAPATATHIATKLARHFAGDDPPPAMVSRLVAAFRTSGGDLPTVYRALVASPEAWGAQPVKFRTPWEWAVASWRALGVRDLPPNAAVGLLGQLGQPVWRPGQPAGYDDIAASWAGPDALLRRVEAAERLAQRATTETDVGALGAKLFPAALIDATQQAITRAESPGQALALLLASPEMMRR